MDLKDKVAIVTGGGTGLGRVVSLRLADAGADIAVIYSRSAQEALETVAECTAKGVRAIAIQTDVSKDAEVRAMVQRVKSELGRIDVLVNNAGITIVRQIRDLESIAEEDWDRIMAVNVKAAFLATRAVAPHMNEQGAGAIVSTTSVAGLGVSGSSIPYGVSKAALIHLTRWLANALAPNIRVNSVAPGLLRTRWWGDTPEERLDQYEQMAPLKRATSVEDTADAIMLTITNDSMTGQTIVVDAGLLVR